MTIPVLPEGMCLSLPPMKDNNMQIILSYSSSKYRQNGSDAAFISRIAEIFLLGKMRPLAENLKALTGINIPAPDTSAEEINHLLERCDAIYNREMEECDRCEREASKAEHAFMVIKKPAQSVSDSLSRSKHAIHAAENNAELTASRLINQKKRVADIKGLNGLLYHEANALCDEVDIKRCAPQVSRIPAVCTRRGELLFDTAADTCNSIDSLKQAANDIVQKCTPPTDKYEIAHNGIIKSQAYRHYYQYDNDLLRAIVSADEYAKYIAEFGWFTKESRVSANTSLNISVNPFTSK